MGKKKEMRRLLKCSIIALLSNESSNYGVSPHVKDRMTKFAEHVTSNPSVDSNKEFYKEHVLKSKTKRTRKGKIMDVPYTESELESNSQQWLNHCIGSMLRRGIIKTVSTF